MKKAEDNLEKYILENRKKFDRYTPDASIRKKLFSNTVKGKRIFLYKTIMRAASVIFIGGLTIILAYNAGSRRNAMMLSGISPELAETQQYYEVLMNTVLTKANPIFINYPGLEKETRADIDELEKIGEELREDLKDNISNRNVVESLIVNYRLRISILEDLLESINNEENNKGNIHRNEF